VIWHTRSCLLICFQFVFESFRNLALHITTTISQQSLRMLRPQAIFWAMTVSYFRAVFKSFNWRVCHTKGRGNLSECNGNPRFMGPEEFSRALSGRQGTQQYKRLQGACLPMDRSEVQLICSGRDCGLCSDWLLIVLHRFVVLKL
jgi:hypothetical protein